MSFRRNIDRPKMPQSGYHIGKHNPAKIGHRRRSLLHHVMRLRQQVSFLEYSVLAVVIFSLLLLIVALIDLSHSYQFMF